MGVSFSAAVAVGVRLSDFCEVREVASAETRYHERTGQPYQKKFARKVVFIFGVEAPGLDPSPDEWEKTLGLRVFNCDDGHRGTEADLTKCVAGVVVAISGSSRFDFAPLTVVAQAEIDKARAAVVRAILVLADRLGAVGRLAELAVQQFLIANVSC